MGWLIEDRGGAIGPLSDGEMRERIRMGRVRPTTNVRHDTAEDWSPAHRHLRALAVYGPDESGLRNYRHWVPPSRALPLMMHRWRDVWGRSNRGEFVWALIFGLILLAVLWPIGSAIRAFVGGPPGLLSVPVAILLLLPTLTLLIRRTHDCGWSAWWLLVPVALALLPLAAPSVPPGIARVVAYGPAALWLLLLYLMIRPPQPRANRFG